MKVGRTFYFDAAHFLPDYQGKCEKMHGHTYRLDIVVEDEIGGDGMVMDFNKLKSVVKNQVLDKLDHENLNDVLENPTAENIVEWIWTQLDGKIRLQSVRMWEGQGKWVEKTRK
ncbi:MAG: 6-carboxytetrahydropterin synthase QueD [Candidatus Altiarchaeota archaeon]